MFLEESKHPDKRISGGLHVVPQAFFVDRGVVGALITMVFKRLAGSLHGRIEGWNPGIDPLIGAAVEPDQGALDRGSLIKGRRGTVKDDPGVEFRLLASQQGSQTTAHAEPDATLRPDPGFQLDRVSGNSTLPEGG
jgi:hypothetical protein